MKSPKVSVFLSYYNDAKFLKSSIDAILAQDFTDFELILLNHATTDDSRDIARSYDDPRIVHIDKDFNYGAGCGLLIRDMLNVARGKYIKLCCADDVLHRDCLSKLVEYLDNNSNCGFVCSKMDFIAGWGKKISGKYFDFLSNQEINSGSLLKSLSIGKNVICYPTVMMRKDVLSEFNLDASFILLLDASFYVNVLVNGWSCHRLDDELISYRLHAGQTSRVCGDSVFMETVAFAGIFYNIKNVEYVKDICADVSFAQNLTQSDEKWFPFVMAVHFLMGTNISFAISGYLYIHQLMNDDNLRAQVEQKFGFKIADFRKLYQKSNAFQYFIDTESKKLTILQLIKLLCRRIFRVLTPKYYANTIRNFRIKNKGVKK